MSVKDPKMNYCSVSAEVVEPMQERVSGAYVVGKVKIKIFNLAYDKEAKKEVYDPGFMEVKTMGKAEGLSPYSPLAVMRKLKEGDKAIFEGEIRWDYWVYNDKKCSKMYIDARKIGSLQKDEPKAKPVEQTETEAGTTEDDLPF